MSSKILAFLRSHIDIIVPSPSPERQEVTLLDYACGTGLVTQALRPYISQALGIDISSAMVERYNTVFESSTHPSSTSTGTATTATASTVPTATFSAHAILGDLLSDPPPPSSEQNQGTDPSPSAETTLSTSSTFDIVAVGLGFHHFASPADALKRLARRTRKGGTVVIVDFAPFEAAGGHGHHHHLGHGGAHGQHGQHLGHDVESAQSHSGETNAPNNAFPAAASATIRTHGFSEEAMKELFEGAGLREFRYREMEGCLLYTSPSPRDGLLSRMPSSA